MIPNMPVIEQRGFNITAKVSALSQDDHSTKETLSPMPIYPKPFEEVMTKIGVPESDWPGMLYIAGQESGFCALKWEGQRYCPTEYVELYSPDAHVGYGWCQATPANKYAEEGADWKTNVLTQARWCYKYAKSYGSIDKAVNFKKCLRTCWSPRTNSQTFKETTWF